MTHRIPHPKRILLFLTVAIAALIGFAGTASAAGQGSIVFIKNNDIWLANPDGSHQFRVTWDGSEDFPTSPPARPPTGRSRPGTCATSC